MTGTGQTLNYSNWRSSIRQSCTSKIIAYKHRKTIREPQTEWHCYLCMKQKPAPLDDIRRLFGPRDKNNQITLYRECGYDVCPTIHKEEKGL